MSVDLKRLQSLAAPLDMNLVEVIAMSEYERKTCGDYKYILEMPDGESIRALTLTPIRERLEAEYRKLAIEVDRLWLLRYKVEDTVPRYEHSFGYDMFTAIADELAVKEPTMVESPKLKQMLSIEVDDNTHQSVLVWAIACIKELYERLDALIDLYERKEK